MTETNLADNIHQRRHCRIARRTVYWFSPKMKYQAIIMFYSLTILYQLTAGNSYNCSQFIGFKGDRLQECPPAKFMVENKLVECFDNYTKNDYNGTINVLQISCFCQDFYVGSINLQNY